jgi:hypothetical protein
VDADGAFKSPDSVPVPPAVEVFGREDCVNRLVGFIGMMSREWKEEFDPGIVGVLEKVRTVGLIVLRRGLMGGG